MHKENISTAVIRRLPRYYRHLVDLEKAGTERISSSMLGKNMGLTASQIRQDLSCFGGFGQQGYGYNVTRLREAISEILGMDRNHTAVIVGVGNIGRALVENFPFEKNGFRLLAAFDVEPAVVGTTLGNVMVQHADNLEVYLQENTVDVAGIAVTASAARDVALRLYHSGIRGIWNFTNVEMPEQQMPGVMVENIHFADSLLTLSYKITDMAEEQV